jgi:epoxyqueuosine reductase
MTDPVATKITINRDELASRCREQGLQLLGIVALQPEPQAFARFEHWLAKGWQAGMDFLQRYKELRYDPRGLMPGSQTALVIALPYALSRERGAPAAGKQPTVAQYALYRDYHKTIRRQASKLLEQLKGDWGLESELNYRVTVDSAPVLERSLAARTAKGFIGKNTCYIHPDWGSFLLLGEILLDRPLEPDERESVDPTTRVPGVGGCGSCRRCQVHCPTGALDQAFQLDANRCLAYWTIEHRGTIPFEFWPWLALYWFGCDICQNVCPYNRTSTQPVQSVSKPRRELLGLDLFEVATMDQAFYEATFGGTPMTRAKRQGLRRNALIALTVRGDSRVPKLLEQLKDDADQVVAQTAEQAASWMSLDADEPS